MKITYLKKDLKYITLEKTFGKIISGQNLNGKRPNVISIQEEELKFNSPDCMSTLQFTHYIQTLLSALDKDNGRVIITK